MGDSAQMGSAVKNTLRSICCDNGWSYGVFWRFDQSNSMLLTLEDAYFEEQMGTMLGNMFVQVHMLGEGFVGQSAFTGKHLWMLGDSLGDQDIFHGDSEISCQFSSGIKTIAIIPVEPGVVLFGSIHKILESPEFLDRTKRLFKEMNNVDALDQLEYLPSSLTCETSDLDGIFASLISYGNSHTCNELGRGCSSMNPTQSSPFFSDLHQAMTDLPRSCNNSQSFAKEAQVLSSSEPSTEFQHVLQSSSTDLSQCYSVGNLSELLGPMEMALTNMSQSNVASLLSSDLVGSEGLVQNSMGNTINCSEQEKLGIFHVAEGGIFDGLGCWEDIVAPVECSGQSTISTGISECISGPHKGLFSELGIYELLNGIGSSSPVDQFSTNKKRVKCSSVESNSVQLDKMSNIAEPRKHEEPTKRAKKRARPGESTRPRPKDRQLIQDRLTELRKIIPNGHKPSIDVLLDRTIKYMHFLQSVTKYGDKLNQPDEPKMIDRGSGVVLKDNDKDGSNGGATWAYEVGGQTLVCPIVVENLTPPGQMLIEMLCEDHGFFLEIADVIRGFGLNILKGVMELRQNKIWARFIVEANKHVTRMDVFWSLVRLLQQTATSEIDTTNVVMKSAQRPPLLAHISVPETLQ